MIDRFARRLSNPLFSVLFLTVAGTVAAASIPARVFLRLVLPRTTALALLSTRQEFAILRRRRVLDHGKDRRGCAALGTVDMRRLTWLVHRV